MKTNHKLTQRLIAAVLVLSLFLQSCGGLSNQLAPKVVETTDGAPGPTRQTEAIKHLIKQKLTAENWELDDIYEEKGSLQVQATEKLGNFTKSHVLSVAVDPGVNLEHVSKLTPQEQHKLIHLPGSKYGKPKHISIVKSGLAGGMMEGEEKEENKPATRIVYDLAQNPTYRRRNFNTSLPSISADNIQYIKEIGIGGMGNVLQAVYQQDTVAVKSLHNLRPEQIEAFKREAIIIANLKHPNIINFLGFFKTPSMIYRPTLPLPGQDALMMEYASQGSLWNLLKNNQDDTSWDSSWQLRYQVALDVAEGLSYLHQWDIVHCDLKGENILLDDKGRAKITDFGTAALKNENQTYGEWLGGTWRWMAPELFGQNRNSKAGDVYSYGMVLWQLGAREQPFKRFDNAYLIAKHVTEGNKETLTRDTPVEIKKVINLCWLPEMQRPTVKQIRHLLEAGHHDFVDEEKEALQHQLKEKEEYIQNLAGQVAQLTGEKNLLVQGKGELEQKLQSLEEEIGKLKNDLEELDKEKDQTNRLIQIIDHLNKDLIEIDSVWDYVNSINHCSSKNINTRSALRQYILTYGCNIGRHVTPTHMLPQIIGFPIKMDSVKKLMYDYLTITGTPHPRWAEFDFS